MKNRSVVDLQLLLYLCACCLYSVCQFILTEWNRHDKTHYILCTARESSEIRSITPTDTTGRSRDTTGESPDVFCRKKFSADKHKSRHGKDVEC